LYKLGDFFDIPLEGPIDGDAVPAGPVGLKFVDATTHDRDREFHFDFEIPAGAKLMTAGSSYSLQKGLIDLVMRHQSPRRGVLLYGGHDIADLHLHCLRDGIALVDNSGVLERSIEDNLRGGNSELSRAELRTMLAVVGLDAVVNGLPQGLNTPLGAFGYPLSRSETIRLKIAAALLARPQVLILTQVFDSLSHAYRRAIVDHVARLPDLTFIHVSNRRDIGAYREYLYLEPGRHVHFDSLTALLAFERTAAGGQPPTAGEMP
jgi:putative ABC transport system ATP-binding protein